MLAAEVHASAETWLSLVDNHSYGASWEAAAGLFRNAFAQKKWEAAAETAPGALAGTLSSKSAVRAGRGRAPVP